MTFFFFLDMTVIRFLISLIIVSFFLTTCRQKESTPPLFQLMENTGIHFSNDIHNTKDFNIFSYRNFYNGGGVAIGDINNDGFSDVFFTANMGSNKLYLNKGSWKFEDVSGKAGFVPKQDWSTGVVMVDINSDGWLDIYVCNAGYINGAAPESKLYINNGNLTFTESAKKYGLANSGGYATHAAFFDYDKDGDLDVFIINNSFIPVNTLNYANKRNLRAKDWPVADFLKGGGDRFLRNDSGKFTDISPEAGIHGSLISFGLGVTVGDVNGDHYPDVYVSNDFFERDYLYINQKNGTFKDSLEQWVQHTSHSSMGADIGDINNDGYPDIFTTDMLPADDYRLKTTSSFENIDVNKLKVQSGFYNQYMQNTLQVNNGNGKFVETGYYSGVAASDWSWGGLIFDADNDGLSDIYVCNGIYNDVTDQDFIDFFANDIIQNMVMTGQKNEIEQVLKKMPSHPIPNRAFKNRGNLHFTDEAEAWGLAQPSFSNGAAYGDLDNDGDLDLVTNNVNQKAFVYKNDSREVTKNNFIGFGLKGKEANTFAIGSTVKVFQGAQVISRELMPARGFQSSVDYKIIIGLGTGAADSVQIIWPDGSVTKLNKPAVNVIHRAQQEGGKAYAVALLSPSSLLLNLVQGPFEKHREDDYVDFYYERAIPMMMSREGPKAAYGDVNGDGLEDIYIGGAANQAGQLYLQTLSGFVLKKEEAFERSAMFEDVAALFFDVDKDGDLDLFVGSGGNHHASFSLEFQNRLYYNDGKGDFEFAVSALPNSGTNTSIAAANDFDGDGDLDLFVGSRNIPQNYGVTPQSFLLVNDGTGKFSDIGPTNKSIANAGMLTGAVWANVWGDARKELIVVGDWMPPRIFSYTNDHFEEVKTNLGDLQGWWQTVSAADLNGDGFDDLVLGNIGENFYLRPDGEHPVKMFIADFDGNGNTEKIITRTIDGKDKPVFLKREVVEQIASLRKQNLKYGDYANKSIQELFSKEVMDKCIVKSFTYASSCIAFSDGKGLFTVQKLPYMVQLSSVNAALPTDINGDGAIDLLLGGNQFNFLPQFSRIDASYGHLLLNDGKGGMQWLNAKTSGLSISGEIRDIKEVKSKGNRYFLMLQNNDYPLLFGVKRGTSEKVVKSEKGKENKWGKVKGS